MTLLDILATLTRANEEQRLGLSKKALYRAAQIHHSRLNQRVPPSLEGTLPYPDPVGNQAVANCLRHTKRKRAA